MKPARVLQRLLVAVTSVVALVLGTAGIATQAQAATARTWTVYVGSQSPSGQVQGMAFASPDISINVGDTIHFVVKSMEPHTVSFYNATCPPGSSPFDPCVGTPTSAPITAPGQFRNSGFLSTIATVLGAPVTSWDLRFDGIGTYDYLCYLHSAPLPGGGAVGMTGVVRVRPAGTAYPQTQADIDAAYHDARSAAIEDGNAIWGAARNASDPHHIFIGASDDMAMVMAFIRTKAVINVGESITFDMGRNAVPVPHTVTFGTEPASPFPPVGDPTHYTGGTLSSGILEPVGPGPHTFTVTFDKAGTYTVYCMLHDEMGMVGTIVVH